MNAIRTGGWLRVGVAGPAARRAEGRSSDRAAFPVPAGDAAALTSRMRVVW